MQIYVLLRIDAALVETIINVNKREKIIVSAELTQKSWNRYGVEIGRIKVLSNIFLMKCMRIPLELATQQDSICIPIT